MKLKNLLIGLVAAGMLGAAGFGLYRLGLRHATETSAGAPAPATGAASAAQAPAAVDPSTWGVAEGEAATRRHIADGLKAGMIATVEASAGNGKPYVSVPLSALAQKDGYTIVWVVDRGTETVSSRPVTLSDFTADGVRVTDGLEVGDLVVAAGTQFMADDLKVTISNATTQHSASAQAEVPLLR